jgi:hypothetical protein
VWQGSRDRDHVTGITWQGSRDRDHVTGITWQGSRDRGHVTGVTWQGSCDRDHVTGITRFSLQLKQHAIYLRHDDQFKKHHMGSRDYVSLFSMRNCLYILSYYVTLYSFLLCYSVFFLIMSLYISSYHVTLHSFLLCYSVLILTWIHFLRSDLCPPTSYILSVKHVTTR